MGSLIFSWDVWSSVYQLPSDSSEVYYFSLSTQGSCLISNSNITFLNTAEALCCLVGLLACTILIFLCFCAPILVLRERPPYRCKPKYFGRSPSIQEALFCVLCSSKERLVNNDVNQKTDGYFLLLFKLVTGSNCNCHVH